MSDRIGSMRQQFERNFEQNAVEDVSQTDTGGDGKDVKGKKNEKKHGLETTPPPTTYQKDGVQSTANQPVQVQVMMAMLAAYNSNTVDIINKGNQMQAATAIGQSISNADAVIESAALQGNGGATVKVVPDDSSKADTNNGSTAYITQTQADEMGSQGLTIPTSKTYSTTDLSNLTSEINNIQQTLNGNTEYTMLQLQTDTQNQTQDSSMASGTLKSIGDSIAGVARNVGG